MVLCLGAKAMDAMRFPECPHACKHLNSFMDPGFPEVQLLYLYYFPCNVLT